MVVTDRSRVGSGCCVSFAGGTVGAGVATEGVVTVGATVVTVCAGAGFWVGGGVTVAVGVAGAVGGWVTTGSLEGTVADCVAVDGTVDDAEVAVDVAEDADDAGVELLDGVLVASVDDVALAEEDVDDVVVGSEDDVDALVDVVDVSEDVAVVDDEVVVVDVLDDELDDVVSTTGTGNRVSGEDGRTGSGSPGGGKVAAGFCSTTLYVKAFHCWISCCLCSGASTLCTVGLSACNLSCACCH